MAAGGPLDILVNNAGVVSGRPLLELPDEKIEASFAVGVNASMDEFQGHGPH